jgi:hypothetical protein
MIQNRPGLQVAPASEAVTRSNLASFEGTLVPGRAAGLNSVIEGGDLNAFPRAARELLMAFWQQIEQTGTNDRPSMPIVGRIAGWDFVPNVDPGPQGYSNQDEGGDRIYVWDGDSWYFGTWFGRWYKDPTQNPILEPSPLDKSYPLSIPSGTLFNGSMWEAGDVVNPAGTLLLPPTPKSFGSSSDTDVVDQADIDAPSAISATTLVLVGLGLLVWQRRKG